MDRMTVEEKAELAEVYEKAADWIEVNGWSREDDNPESGCFVVATSAAAYDLGNRGLAWKANRFAEDVLELGPRGWIVDWNDAPGRTKSEVINTLHALANKLR